MTASLRGADLSSGASSKVDSVIRIFAALAVESSAAIELAHHVRKPVSGAAVRILSKTRQVHT